ncbi:MAG TPA: hypothetical protein VE029_12920 [Rhizobacter sp.]|nr:hypothetical protein [Rhizobacter sp.]
MDTRDTIVGRHQHAPLQQENIPSQLPSVCHGPQWRNLRQQKTRHARERAGFDAV